MEERCYPYINPWTVDSAPAGCQNPLPGRGWTGSIIYPLEHHHDIYPDRGFRVGHPALDFDAPTGTPVRATATGSVIWAGWCVWGYGNLVILDHGAGFRTLYAHLDTVSALCGTVVTVGTTVGTVGMSGNTSFEHVHFEVRRGCIVDGATQWWSCDPHRWLGAEPSPPVPPDDDDDDEEEEEEEMTALRNPSFEGITRPGEWTRDTHTGVEYGEIYCPAGWTAWWQENDTFRRPEMKVIQRVPPFLDPPRIHEGDWAFQSFTMFGRQHAGLYQVVAGLTPDAVYELSAFAHAWSLHPGIGEQSPYCSSGVGCEAVYIPEGNAPLLNGDNVNDAIGNFLFRLGVSYGDPDPLGAVDWGDGAHIYNAYREVPPLRFIAPANGKVTVYLCATSIWNFKTSDAYWGSVKLEEVDEMSERGKPRIQYPRTYVLLPPEADTTWATMVANTAWDDRRYTIGGSADDAGIGDLDHRRVVIIKPESWPGGEAGIVAFYQEYYPDVDLVLMPGNSSTVQAQLKHLVQSDNYPFDPGPPGPTPPPPPPPPPPPVTPRVTRGHLGLHLQTMVQGWDSFVSDLHPPLCKVLASMEDVKGLARACPDTIRVWRHVENKLDGIFPNPDAHEGARRWIGMFEDGLYQICDEMAQEFPHLPEPYVYVESANEIYNSDYEIVRQAAAFDLAFCEELMALDLPVRPVAFTAAVGNPHHLGGQYELLVPLARKCQEVGGLFGYHAYFLANPQYGGPDHLWKYLAGRWTEIDDVLRAHRVHMRWFFGECGGVGGRSGYRPDGTGWVSLNANSGWKDGECYAGDWPRYLADLMRFDELVAEWNALHEDRAVGGTIFTSGASFCGWSNFQLRKEQFRDMAIALLSRYP